MDNTCFISEQLTTVGTGNEHRLPVQSGLRPADAVRELHVDLGQDEEHGEDGQDTQKDLCTQWLTTILGEESGGDFLGLFQPKLVGPEVEVGPVGDEVEAEVLKKFEHVHFRGFAHLYFLEEEMLLCSTVILHSEAHGLSD